MFCSMHGRKENPSQVGMEGSGIFINLDRKCCHQWWGGGGGGGGGEGGIFYDIGFLLIFSYSSYYGSSSYPMYTHATTKHRETAES